MTEYLSPLTRRYAPTSPRKRGEVGKAGHDESRGFPA